jgi:hypothetical protein
MKTFLSKLQQLPIIMIMAAPTTLVHASTNASFPVKEDGHYLEIKGVITGSRNFLQEAEILVYEEDDASLYITDLTNKMGRSTLQLPFNQQFRLVFSKAGYISKSIVIDTHVSDTSQVYHFKYTVELFEFEEGLDMTLLNKPIAKVLYSPDDKNFVYDEKYTEMVNEEVRLMYEKYAAAKRPEAE